MRGLIVLLMWAVVPGIVSAEPSAAFLFERYREATGGDRWLEVVAIEGHGRLSAGGLEGRIDSIEHLADGRNRSVFQLGPAQGGGGWDGERAWSLHSDGEVIGVDEGSALRRIRTDIWMARRGMFDPQRLGATVGAVQSETGADGLRYLVRVTPVDADPIELVFSDSSGLLMETRIWIDERLVSTRLEDYREIDGLRLPQRLSVDQGDPRLFSSVVWERYGPTASVAEDSFAAPERQLDFRFSADGPVELPFELINNHIYLQVELDGKPLKMLFDTGGVNLLTSTAARRLGLQSEGQLAARGVGEQQQDVGFAQAASLRIGHFELDQPLFYVIDLAPMMPVEGIEFDGLVGFEVFKRVIVRIDYPGRRLLLYPPDAAPAALGETLPFVLDDRTPMIDGRIDGKPVRFAVDTGSRATLTIHSPFARANELDQRYAVGPLAVNGWGVGGPMSSRAFRIGLLELGSIRLEQVTADMFLGEKGAFASADADANLGSGVLKAFIATFDYANRRISLAQGPSVYRDEGYDRLGMWLNLAGDGSLEVAAVTADGPAESAGVRVGDRIERIAGEPVAARGLAEWRSHARAVTAGSKLPLDLQDGRQIEILPSELVPGG